MKEFLRKYLIIQVPSCKEEEIEEILSIFEVKEFKKGEYFKEPFKAGKEIGCTAYVDFIRTLFIPITKIKK
jgi:hypothetical protein